MAHKVAQTWGMTEFHPRTEPVMAIAVDPQRDGRWDAYVEQHPDGLIYHHSAWLKVLEQTYGYPPVAFACADPQGSIRGVLPMCHKRGLLTGARLVSLPHTPMAGPLADDKVSAEALIQAALQSAGRHNIGVELKLSLAFSGSEVNCMTTEPWENTFVLDLQASGSTLRFGDSRNHGRLKWAIHKASKFSVTTRWAETKKDLEAWYDLYLLTMRRHTMPPRPYRFFESAWGVLQPRGFMRLLLAEKAAPRCDQLLAGSIFLCFNKTVFYAFNGSRHTDLSSRPNDLIQWTALHRFFEQGFERYDFGEVESSNPGLMQFKLKWGAKPRLLLRTYHPRKRRTSQHSLGESLRRGLSGCWRLVPLRATAIVGRWFYRYV